MRKSLILLFFCCVAHTIVYPYPKYEVRAAWLTTISGLDWPHTYANSPEGINKQKQELRSILDKLQTAHFNTVLFQVRTRGEVLYASAIEPYSATLTGRSGNNPGYDPLEFIIQECHKRGMECHAWLATIPLGDKQQINKLGNRSVVKKHKNLCVMYRNEYYLNPGNPHVKEYLMNLIKEIVSLYDVDGIHLDYLRYPERTASFPDKQQYRQYGKGETIENWRRNNITEIMRYIYHGVKAIKPWVKVSTSPLGKYKDTSRYSSKGWNAFHTVCQDPQRWLREGIQDQVYPMLYFKENNFFPFALDWKEQSNNRHIVPGLGVYFLHPDHGNWKTEDIERQLYFLRNHHFTGAGYFRVAFLMDNVQGIYNELVENFYLYPALQPPMPWLDNSAPTPPAELTVSRHGSGYTILSWTASKDNDTLNPPKYVIYASDTYPVDITKPENIIATNISDTTFVHAPVFPWETKAYYAVTAIDRYGNESMAVTQ